MAVPAQIAFSITSDGSNLRVYSSGAVAGDAPMNAVPSDDTYLQPDGVSNYLQPDGVSLYLQPAF